MNFKNKIKYMASTDLKRKENQEGFDFLKLLKIKLLHWLQDTKKWDNLVAQF